MILDVLKFQSAHAGREPMDQAVRTRKHEAVAGYPLDRRDWEVGRQRD